MAYPYSSRHRFQQRNYSGYASGTYKSNKVTPKKEVVASKIERPKSVQDLMDFYQKQLDSGKGHYRKVK